jgi:hypothetical protein
MRWRPLLPACRRFMRSNARSILLVFPAVSGPCNGIEGCTGACVNHPQCVESAGIEHSLPDSSLFLFQCRSWIGFHAPPRGEAGPLIIPCMFKRFMFS